MHSIQSIAAKESCEQCGWFLFLLHVCECFRNKPKSSFRKQKKKEHHNKIRAQFSQFPTTTTTTTTKCDKRPPKRNCVFHNHQFLVKYDLHSQYLCVTSKLNNKPNIPNDVNIVITLILIISEIYFRFLVVIEIQASVVCGDGLNTKNSTQHFFRFSFIFGQN